MNLHTTPGAFGRDMPPRNPAGSKLLRRWAKAHSGGRTAAAQATKWYAGYLSEADRVVRGLEAERRELRQRRAARQQEDRYYEQVADEAYAEAFIQ